MKKAGLHQNIFFPVVGMALSEDGSFAVTGSIGAVN